MVRDTKRKVPTYIRTYIRNSTQHTEGHSPQASRMYRVREREGIIVNKRQGRVHTYMQGHSMTSNFEITAARIISTGSQQYPLPCVTHTYIHTGTNRKHTHIHKQKTYIQA